MKSIVIPICIFSLFACNQAPQKTEVTEFDYPETFRGNVTDTFFGTIVADPYRWLEDENSKETMAWVDNQNMITQGYLQQLPMREDFKNRMTELMDYEKMGGIKIFGSLLFYFKNSGLQPQSVLYYKNRKTAEEKVALDPNTMSEDGTVSIGSYAVSKDGKYLAFTKSSAGSDWVEINIKDLSTNTLLEDIIPWVKFSGISWHGNGFYYSCFDAPEEGKELSVKNKNHKVNYHTIGTNFEQDQLIFTDPAYPLRTYYHRTTPNEDYMFLLTSAGTSGNGLKIKDLNIPGAPFITIVEDLIHDSYPVDVHEGMFYMMTNRNADNNKVVKIDLSNVTETEWKDVIPNGEHLVSDARMIKESLVITFLVDVSNEIKQFDLEGKPMGAINIPENGIIAELAAAKNDSEIYYSYTSYTEPSSIYKYNLTDQKTEIYFKPSVKFESSDFETKKIFYTSKDGEKVPMFITYKKGLKLDGSNPTMLYGYGGFDISIKPTFNTSRIAWMEKGGVYAAANIRGGSEYGQRWHKGGMLLNKQTVFDDFIAAAEYLIDNQYTSSEKLAVHGRSNGGLLVGAMITQRPDLFAVAVPAVGVLDMLRYQHFTIGRAWAGEYGTSEDSVHFRNIFAYSPLHNLKKGTIYPATMILTADHDDRVVPAHSFKFAAELQYCHEGENPVLIRIDTKSGHGSGKPLNKSIEEWADTWTFILENTKDKPEM